MPSGLETAAPPSSSTRSLALETSLAPQPTLSRGALLLVVHGVFTSFPPSRQARSGSSKLEYHAHSLLRLRRCPPRRSKICASSSRSKTKSGGEMLKDLSSSSFNHSLFWSLSPQETWGNHYPFAWTRRSYYVYEKDVARSCPEKQWQNL